MEIPLPVPARQDDVKVGETVQTAVQSDAASRSTAWTRHVPSETAAQQNDALEAKEEHVSDGSGGASADTAANSADGARPGAGGAAGDEPASAAPQDDVDAVSPVLPDAVQDPSFLTDDHGTVLATGAEVSAVSLPAPEQQIAKVSAPQQEHQQLSDTADAGLDVEGLDSISSSPPPYIVTTQSGAGRELPLADDSSPHDATLSKLGYGANVADGRRAGESPAAEEPEQADATGPPGAMAFDLANSSAASPDVLSALGSVGSDAGLSGLSLGADSMEEPELDQLSLDGLDDAAFAPADGLLATEVSAKTTMPSAAPVSLVPASDASDVRAEGLSDSEVDFDSAGELSEPQLASALQPPAAEELQPAAVPEPQPPAPIAVNVGHVTSTEAVEAADPGIVTPDAAGDPAAAAQPFSARAARDEVGAADAPHNHDDVRPWEAALTAAEAAEAELLQGAVPTRRTTVSIQVQDWSAPRLVIMTSVSNMLCEMVP